MPRGLPSPAHTISSSSHPRAAVLVAEILVDENNTEWQSLMTCHMIVCFNALERTEGHYRHLLKETGWELKQTSRTSGPLSLLEATAV